MSLAAVWNAYDCAVAILFLGMLAYEWRKCGRPAFEEVLAIGFVAFAWLPLLICFALLAIKLWIRPTPTSEGR